MSNKFANFLYFDTHCHLNYEPLFGNEAKIIDECVKEKVMVNCVGVNLDTCKKSLVIARQFPNQTIVSLGLHPESIDELKQINELENMIKDNLDYVKAIGECGLDYHYQPLDKQKQKDLFIAQILLAIKYNLPLIIHCRDAYEDLYGILEEYFPQLSKILIHCFDGTKEWVEKFNKFNVYYAIGGKVTYPNAQYLREAVKYIPKNRLVLETDAPWLTPMPNRKEVNTPINVIKVYEYLKDMLGDDNIQLIYQNSLELFGLK